MVYLPTFTIKNNQMLVNITYMDPMGMGAYWKIISLGQDQTFARKNTTLLPFMFGKLKDLGMV